MIATTMLLTWLIGVGAGQTAQPAYPVQLGMSYELLPGSSLTDLYDLGPGDPVHKLEGSFRLRALPTGAPFPSYRLSQIRFRAPGVSPQYTVDGGGLYHTVGLFPGGSQQMELRLGIGQSSNVRMTSGLAAQEAPFETIEIVVQETSTTGDHFFVLRLIAEPRRPISFSTGVEFTSGNVGQISAGDLLGSRGLVRSTNSELTALLGIMPIAPDIGLDAIGRTPATRSILFSGDVDVFSETLGALQHGDLLNVHGFVAQTNQELTAAFRPQPVVPDAGLDAFHVDLSTGELWFSLEDPLFSKALGITLQPGDLLSSAGYVVKSNAELLQRFEIVDADPAGYGLDAVTRRPNGTILFSVERDFLDARLGPVGHGDLLSDNGHLILGNLDLVWPFEPVEDLADFGLDALQVLQN